MKAAYNGFQAKTSIAAPRRKSFARITFIHRLIKARRYPNVPKLAEILEVSSRTIERDIEAMRDFFQAPLDYDSAKKGFFYRHDFELPNVKLTEGEAVALLLSQQLFSRYKGAAFGKVLASALEKIIEILPESISLEMDALEKEISFGVPAMRGEEGRLAEVYYVICEAISQQKTLSITYYTASRGSLTKRLIDPCHLRYYQGAWYVLAYCHLRQQMRVFALDRIRDLQLTEKSFNRPKDFSPEEILQNSFGIEIGTEPVNVKVRFDAFQARFIRERAWHNSQELEELSDGGLILKMTVSSLGEVKRWLLSFGAHAEVLAPMELRQEMAQEANLLTAVYSPKI